MLLINSSFSQVVSSDSKTQPTTIKPGELAGSSFNGDVNLFTGTYGASYTLGSVATPGGLKYDVTMVYSSSLSAGDNVPVASGIPYGEGWSVQVPTISVSAAEYKKYSDQVLMSAANNATSIDDSKTDAGKRLLWFSPMVNIPGVASGRAVFKHIDKATTYPLFVLQTFENQYIEMLYWANTWEVFLPDGTSYFFGGSSVSYSKGYNRRLQDEGYNDGNPLNPTFAVPYNNIEVEKNIKPNAEKLNWHCTVIRNRNMPQQFITFSYKGFGKFNFFKEFSYDYMPKLNVALIHNTTAYTSGLPNLEVTSDIFLSEVRSSAYGVGALDRVVLEYGTESYGTDMLNPNDEGVQRLDSLYNYKTVYTANFSNWKQYMHPKHPSFGSNSSILPSSNNPFVAPGLGAIFGFVSGAYIRRDASVDASTSSNLISFNHGFLESPRLGSDNSNFPENISLIGGDIYEIKTKIHGDISSSNPAFGFANIDINIASGRANSFTNTGTPYSALGAGVEIVNAYNKDNNYTNEPIFSTFGNAVKWNPAAAAGGSNVSTSNFFTMPNIPLEYNGITIQVGPSNSDNFFNMTPYEITTNGLLRSAHRSYWRENQIGNSPIVNILKQHYEPVPSNFGVGLPWQMMKPIAQRFLSSFFGTGGNPDENSDLFKFWWYDAYQPLPTGLAYPNVPTLLNENVRLSDVELVRYSKNPYMLQSVKTYKTNGDIKSPPYESTGIILVNQFDMDYIHEDVLVLDNAVYAVGEQLNYNTVRWTNTYLLTKIKNVPVNGSKDIDNILPLTTNEAPTTHFDYDVYQPGIVISSSPGGQNDLRTNTSLFPLKKVISHLGKETIISYYPFNDARVSVISRYVSAPPLSIGGITPPRTLLQERNFAVQINVPVQSVLITDPTSSIPKQWNYNYVGGLSKWERGGNLPLPINDGSSIFSSAYNVQVGWQTTTVTEPEINGQRPYSKYFHHGSSFSVGVTEPNMLFGKLQKVENFNGAGIKLSDKEIIYEVKKAFTNGYKRNDWSGDYHYDYEEFDNPSLQYQPEIPSGMSGQGIISRPSTFLETEFSGYADDSYFIKKVKEIDTEYENTTCNIPNSTTTDPETTEEELRPAANPPSEPITNVQSKEGDNILISIINTNKLGKNLDTELIAASPLSDDVLIAFLNKIPFYKPKTYHTVLEAQPVLSDAVFSKLLTFPTNIRESLVRNTTLNQQYNLSANTLRALIAIQPPLDPAIIENALKQFNDLPEDILLSIINRNPKYTPEFITSVLLKQIQLSEGIHQLLLDKKYLPDNVIKKVFINGSSYPTDNTLVMMINRTPDIEPDIIEQVLLASPYAHSQLIMDALITKFSNNRIVTLVQEHNTSLPSWTAYCGNPTTITPLSIQHITEYEYWDADEQGISTSEGFRKLMDVTDATVHLMFEPSWQLYKTKTYSPQLPGAFTEKEYFYYYDLKNKYQRRAVYTPNNSTFPYQYNASLGYINYLTDGVNGEPAGLKLSHEYNLLNIAYQERTTSKNAADASPVARSTFYYYDSDWNDIVYDYNSLVLPYYDIDNCSNSGTDDPVHTRCSEFIFPNKDHEAPLGTTIYLSTSGTYWECPCNYYNPTMIVEASNCDFDGPDATERAPITDMLQNTLLLKEVNTQIDTLVNDAYFSSLSSIPFPSSTGLMEFKIGLPIPFTTEYSYLPIYPFDVLKVKEIKERNLYTQVQLEANEKGLLTRYWYTQSKNTWNINTACQYINSWGNTVFESYSAYQAYNIGVPIAITVGYTLPDSLRTEYEYYPDYSVKQITDPNGIKLSYKYDEYGRLKESYRNNKLLSVNKYSTWNNNINLSFLDRSLSNYVETYQLKDNGNNAALQSRKYIDPLGRDFHTMSAEIPDYTGNSTINWRHFEVVHTGAIIYDNWNRAIETYKPFVDGDGVTPLTWGYVPNSITNSTTNATIYPHISSFAAYENNQKSRVLREAKPGEVLNTAHNVKYRYSMANYVCGGCELELTANEANLIMGSNPTNVRFKVVEVEDEDGKVSKEYFNALGQKVATKQFIGLEEAITLFIYDSYGNLTKVINPEKQESNYSYNMLGWLFQKETVDGGITKYMFNVSGQVVLEQDANARLAVNCDDNTEQPYYRQYNYDIFGRLTSQSKKYYIPTNLDMSANIHLPMLYTNSSINVTIGTGPTGQDIFHNGQFYNGTPNAYVYKFSNNSTYAWKAKTYFIQPSYNSTLWFPIYNFMIVNNLAPKYEKQLNYGELITISPNYHTTTSSILVYGRTNMKGNLSHVAIYGNSTCGNVPEPIKYDFYSYNSDGNLAWQMQQFNANGINPVNKGLVTRIDYPKYDLNNNLLVENIDVNNDLVLDMQYNYTYDYRNRIREVRVSLADEKENGELLASYQYNNATGLVTKTSYHKDCMGSGSNEIAQIGYSYDLRDRLTSIVDKRFFDYYLYYDNAMPITNVGALSTIANFNGNINGTKANYSFSGIQGYVAGSNFDTPTSYVYQYDGINRLTDANAFWNETGVANTLYHIAAKYGDVTYEFDKIGNLTNLKRNIDAFGTIQGWNYNYQPGNNKLTQVQGININTLNRNYTYDDAGNVLTDDYRGVNQSIYGRANLPFNLQITTGGVSKATQYLYDASDARIFKGLYEFAVGDELGVNIGAVLNTEYYLRDAAGNTIGILDLNTGEWTWYGFGRERFAKIKPNQDQQPDFFTIDNQRKDTTFSDSTARRQQFINEVNNVLNADSSIQTQLLKVDLIDGTSFWISENNLTTFTDTVADSTYVITQEMNLTNQNQLVSIDNKLISIGVLTDKNTATADGSIVFRDSSIVIINRDTTVYIDTNSTLRSQGDPTFNYTFHSNTNLNDISYYMYDHLGNTRVVYKPVLTDASVVLTEDFNNATRFSNEVADEFIGSSPCVGCPNWKGYNNLITNVSYDNGRIRCEENPIYTNIYYGLTMPFPTENLKTYQVSFDYDGDGSQLTCGASIRVEISNGTVVNGTQIVGFSTSNSHIEFTFQAQGTVHRLNMIARNTDPSVFPKHFFIDNVEIREVGASSSCNIAYNLEYAADYYPYGKILREWNPQTEKYLTTHHERDTETGLDYRGARYYDSDIARFLSLDEKAAEYAEWTPYVYVGDNPVKFIDPDGKDWLDALQGTVRGATDNLFGTNIRASYTPKDANDYNNALNNVDAASQVTGAALVAVGGGMVAGGTTALAVSGYVAATGVGAVPGGITAAGSGATVGAGLINIGLGTILQKNATGRTNNYESEKNSSSPQKQSKVEKSTTTETVGGGKYTKKTEVRPSNKQSGQSRAEYVRYKNKDGKTIRSYKDSYDKSNKFQHRKPTTGNPEGTRPIEKK